MADRGGRVGRHRARLTVVGLLAACLLAAPACGSDRSSGGTTTTRPTGSTAAGSSGSGATRGPGLGQIVLRADDAGDGWAEAELTADALREAEQRSPNCFVDLTDPAKVVEVTAFEMAPLSTYDQKVVSTVFRVADPAVADAFVSRLSSNEVGECLARGFTTQPALPGSTLPPAAGRGIDEVRTTPRPELGPDAYEIRIAGQLPVGLGGEPVEFVQTTVVLRSGDTFAVTQFNAAEQPFPAEQQSALVDLVRQRLSR